MSLHQPTPLQADLAAVEQAFERALRQIFKREAWHEVEPSAARAWRAMVPFNERCWSEVRDGFRSRWPNDWDDLSAWRKPPICPPRR
jgi:hypothetical protein